MYRSIVLMSLLGLIMSLSGCNRVDWPYYKPYVKGGKITSGNVVSKYNVEMPPHKNVSIFVRTNCYPKYKKESGGHPKGHQDCLIVYLNEMLNSLNINISALDLNSISMLKLSMCP
jgi:hypothetical protein